MSSRELVFRVSIDTSKAKREAANIRTTFERELSTIKTGQIDTGSLKTATEQARQLRQELANIEPPNMGGGVGRYGKPFSAYKWGSAFLFYSERRGPYIALLPCAKRGSGA